MEPRDTAAGWAGRWKFTFPVLLDLDGRVAESYAPPDALPDLPRNQVPIASNLIIDREGRIQFFTLLDSANFDAKLVALRARLDELLAPAAAPTPVVTAVAAPISVTAGGRAQAEVVVSVKGGFHIQANPASEPFLVPLRLEVEDQGGIRAGQPVYPPGQPHRLRGAESELATYEGSVVVRVPLAAAVAAAPGEVSLAGTLRYQACDARVCLKPAAVKLTLSVRVRRPR